MPSYLRNDAESIDIGPEGTLRAFILPDRGRSQGATTFVPWRRMPKRASFSSVEDRVDVNPDETTSGRRKLWLLNVPGVRRDDVVRTRLFHKSR